MAVIKGMFISVLPVKAHVCFSAASFKAAWTSCQLEINPGRFLKLINQVYYDIVIKIVTAQTAVTAGSRTSKPFPISRIETSKVPPPSKPG